MGRTASSRTRRRLLAAAAAATVLPLQAAAEPLRIVLTPYLSPTLLLTVFRPLREHLQRETGRTVEMLTTRDFRQLVEETRRLESDVVQLPAHLARLAMVDWRYRQVAGTVVHLDVVLLVKASGPVHGPAALKGRRVGMLDPLSLTATVGRRWLQQQALGDAVEVVAVPSINSGLISLDREEIAMLVCGESQLAALPATTPRTERLLASIGGIPGPVYVARPGFGDGDLQRLRTAMASFRPDPAKPVSAPNALLRPLDEARLAALDPYAAIARQALLAER